MNSYVRGTFKATNAALYISLGFHPDKVVITNLTDRTGLIWDERGFISGSGAERFGLAVAAAGTRAVTANAAAGIALFDGVDKLAAASTAYLVRNDADQKALDVAAGSEVTTWTLGSAANKTGNFNCDVTGATIGAGSKIQIDGVIYRIVALTAGQGVAANEVTLDGAPASGAVERISSKFDFTGAAIGDIPGKGIALGASATVNDTDGDLCLIEAWGL